MQNHVGFGHLLQRRFERFDQLRGQSAYKTDRVHIRVKPPVTGLGASHCGVKRGEQRVLHQLARSRQAVRQRRLARIGVADHGDGGQTVSAARPALDLAGRGHLRDLLLQPCDARTNHTTVHFDLRLALGLAIRCRRSARPPDHPPDGTGNRPSHADAEACIRAEPAPPGPCPHAMWHAGRKCRGSRRYGPPPSPWRHLPGLDAGLAAGRRRPRWCRPPRAPRCRRSPSPCRTRHMWRRRALNDACSRPSHTSAPAVCANAANSRSDSSALACVVTALDHTPTSTTRSRRTLRYSTSVMSCSSPRPATRLSWLRDSRSAHSSLPEESKSTPCVPLSSSTSEDSASMFASNRPDSPSAASAVPVMSILSLRVNATSFLYSLSATLPMRGGSSVVRRRPCATTRGTMRARFIIIIL